MLSRTHTGKKQEKVVRKVLYSTARLCSEERETKGFFCFGGKKELLPHLCPSSASKNAVANGGGINFAVTGNRKRERPDLLCFADEI